MPQPPLPTFAGPPRQPLHRSSSSNPDRSTTIGDIGPTSAALLASGLLEFRQAGCRFRRLIGGWIAGSKVPFEATFIVFAEIAVLAAAAVAISPKP